ncbi:MAG: type III polyketide synthase [Saprospiraceae bacterium]|nr:type III polyketide synthase [Saprospiraceae bacterium]
MSHIWCIETANPEFCHTRENFTEFYCNAAGEAERTKRKIRAVAHKSGIDTRYSVIKDFSLPPQYFSFFPQNPLLTPAPSLTQRMQIYKKEALYLAEKSVRKIKSFETLKNEITHIVTVTCTGLFAPGLDIELMQVLDLKPTTQRSSINFMGCNAAMLALKQAHQICRSEDNSLVLIVCVELCTLHFQGAFDDDYLISNQIFADGAAAVLVGSKPASEQAFEQIGESLKVSPSSKVSKSFKSVAIKSFKSLVIHEGRDEMAWQLSEEGFKMNLTSYVSPLINKYMPILLEGMELNAEKTTHWAVHPGGKKILDDFCKTININPLALKASYETLRNFGNMSSPTILFVLKNLLENTDILRGEDIITAAFGPGLNIETAVLTYV